MDRDAVDAERAEQIADQRRERAAWCKEKLGDLSGWLPEKDKTAGGTDAEALKQGTHSEQKPARTFRSEP